MLSVPCVSFARDEKALNTMSLFTDHGVSYAIKTETKLENMWFLTSLKYISTTETCVGTTFRTKHH